MAKTVKTAVPRSLRGTTQKGDEIVTVETALAILKDPKKATPEQRKRALQVSIDDFNANNKTYIDVRKKIIALEGRINGYNTATNFVPGATGASKKVFQDQLKRLSAQAKKSDDGIMRYNDIFFNKKTRGDRNRRFARIAIPAMAAFIGAGMLIGGTTLAAGGAASSGGSITLGGAGAGATTGSEAIAAASTTEAVSAGSTLASSVGATTGATAGVTTTGSTLAGGAGATTTGASGGIIETIKGVTESMSAMDKIKIGLDVFKGYTNYKQGKDADAAGRENLAEQARLIKERMQLAFDFIAEQRVKSDENLAKIQEDIDFTNKKLEEAKAAGDQANADMYDSRISQLDKNLEDELAIADKNETEINTKIEGVRSEAMDLYKDDIKAQEAIKAGSLESIDKALEMQISKDKFATDTMKDAIPRSMNDIENSLDQARTKQEDSFRTAITDAQRGAAKRGEDPRRATLNLKIARAKARGKLTADTLRQRAMDRLSVAESTTRLPDGTTQANIAGMRKDFMPTGGSRIADLELDFLNQDVSRADVANSKSEQRRNSAFDRGLAAETDRRNADISRNDAYTNDQINNQTSGTVRQLNEGNRLTNLEANSLNLIDNQIESQADRFGDAAKNNMTNADKYNKEARSSFSDVIAEGANRYDKYRKDKKNG